MKAAAGLPTVVLFGPETSRLHGPLGSATVIYAGLACSPCVSAPATTGNPCTDNVCMRVIGVQTVFQAVNNVLAAPVRMFA